MTPDDRNAVLEAIKDGLDGWIGISDLGEAAEAVLASLSKSAAPVPEEGAETGWLPIESAPRDGAVLLGWPINGVKPGKVMIGCFGGQAWPSHYGKRARHWRPLPTPPAKPVLSGEKGLG